MARLCVASWVTDSWRGFQRGESQTHGRGEWVLILVVGVDGAWLMGLFHSGWWVLQRLAWGGGLLMGCSWV